MRNVMKRKTILLLTAVVMILTVAVGGTVAYLTTRTGEVKNTFEPAYVVPEIQEKFDGTVKKEVQIKNAGNVSAYIRVALIGNWCDAAGNILKSAEVDVNEAGWSEGSDGYYYYNTAVSAGEFTGYLIGTSGYQPTTKPANADHFQLEILAQAIQAEGIQGATSAQDAWIKAVQ